MSRMPVRVFVGGRAADDEQQLAIKSRRSRMSPIGTVLAYALVFFVPVWWFEYQRAARTELGLQVQRLEKNQTALQAALREAQAQLETQRRLELVQRMAGERLGLESVGVDRVLPARALPAAFRTEAQLKAVAESGALKSHSAGGDGHGR